MEHGLKQQRINAKQTFNLIVAATLLLASSFSFNTPLPVETSLFNHQLHEDYLPHELHIRPLRYE